MEDDEREGGWMKKELKYANVNNGEWQAPMANYRMACCDCGLVHRMEFGISKSNQFMFRAWRDEKETKRLRGVR